MAWNEVFITLVVLAVPICVVNLILVILIYHRESLNKLQNALIFSLGCSDFCAGIFAIPSILLCNFIETTPTWCKLCIASYLLNRFQMISSLLHYTVVIFERYLKIVHPFWFANNEYTVLKGTMIVIPLWLTSLLISVLPLTWWSLETPCNSSERLAMNLFYFDLACLALFCLLLAFMMYAFVRIFLVVRCHLVDIKKTDAQLRATSMDNVLQESNQDHYLENGSRECNRRDILPGRAQSTHSSRSGSSYSHNLRRQLLLGETKIVIRFAAMVFMFILVWGAYFTVCVFEKTSGDVPLVAQEIIGVIRFLNPLFDPWILTINNNSKGCACFRNALRNLCERCLPCCSRITPCLPARKQRSRVPRINRDVQANGDGQRCREIVTNI